MLLDERVELGYDYCTEPMCQKKRHRGLKVTTVGVHKSADTLVVGDDREIVRRGESGEFTGRDPRLGLDYRESVPTPHRPVKQPAVKQPGAKQPGVKQPGVKQPAVAAVRHAPAGGPGWSRAQEDVVRLYHDMGLRPDEIVERARRNNPRLGITRRLVYAVLATPAARR
ncbi:hypothetical protein [Pseudonocardia aurantiaca]|uniref:Uncharacterized protein n=1 Tax=Pseudonocardia aurantiaca TaxID=75290 RepID=A0ABW4FMZ7_9PSEU